ncbi:hypothetical protein ACFFR3_19080 [Nonomuraea salmonea]|uniref:Uncharacterized protein n=1 Tax=Nonomuraea salmonea TaxID=46181 RepID=A0ABV5NNT0_9ACTN
MRHDDPPELPDNHLFPGYEGPRGFADALDGGYPIETDLETPPHKPEKDLGPPATPIRGGPLHNPLPPPQPRRFSEDDWYAPEPARARWKIAVPIAVLIASVGFGIWLAIPTDNPPPRAIPATPTVTITPDLPIRSLSTTPTARRTPTPHRSTQTSTPPSVTRSPKRPATRPSKRPQPTVTITTAVTITLRPRTPPSAQGLEEPPRTTTTEQACLTWDDCHDDPPKG